MRKAGKAYFIRSPRRIEDFAMLNPMEKERRFEIVKTVKLAKIDYENFITDMIADRQFIQDHADLCSMRDIWRCLLVQQRGHTDGVLVMPRDERYVGWAAIYREHVKIWHFDERKRVTNKEEQEGSNNGSAGGI